MPGYCLMNSSALIRCAGSNLPLASTTNVLLLKKKSGVYVARFRHLFSPQLSQT
jgi:hypothetical protein